MFNWICSGGSSILKYNRIISALSVKWEYEGRNRTV